MTAGEHKTTVLHLSTSSGPGGAERVISSLAAALNQQNCRVIVGLFRPGWLQDECERLGVETKLLPLPGGLQIGWFRDCLRLVREEQVAIIHAHEFSAVLFGWIVARISKVPFVGTIHGKNYYWEKFRRRLAYRIVSRSGRLVVVSDDLKRFVSQRVGIPESRLHVIYNGVESPAVESDASSQACRAELSLPTGVPVIGTVGSLYPVKGHRHLLDALPAILKRHPRTVLLIAGRGELEMTLKAQATRLGVDGHVRFLGMRNDVQRLLSVMDVFVLPSLSEGLSMALLEAMVSGKAAVATKVGGNPELIDHGKTGFLVLPENSSDLADQLVALLDNPELIRAFGRAGAELVHRRFSKAEMISRYQTLYASLLKPLLSGAN